jgi:hypothetical protein
MAGFDENLVREYFELNGFLVRQLRKYHVQSRKKRADEEIDLLIFNPRPVRREGSLGFQMFAGDIAAIRRAMVVVKGWHSTRFTPSMLRSSSRIFDFLKKDVLEQAQGFFDHEEEWSGSEDPLLKLLVIPSLPLKQVDRQESLNLLREQGIDGIITFQTILENMVRLIDPNNNYQKSELLQLMRLLKVYDMIKPPQMEFFEDATALRDTSLFK